MDDNINIPPDFKILIIDDNIDFLEALKFTLTEKKINVATVESGYKALEVLEEEYFDLILLDLRMPGINGAETFQRIKKMESKPYVVIITAFTEHEQMKIVNKIKPFGFLPKPFELDDLMPYIKKRIKEKVDGN